MVKATDEGVGYFFCVATVNFSDESAGCFYCVRQTAKKLTFRNCNYVCIAISTCIGNYGIIMAESDPGFFWPCVKGMVLGNDIASSDNNPSSLEMDNVYSRDDGPCTITDVAWLD